jgi:7-cyano-7-deazaguanine reductase
MNKVSEIASKHLGQVGGAGYKDEYDPSLLVRIPRSLNREAYKIDNSNLPFKGMDVWNAYEISFLTSNGLPISGAAKITIPADSEYHVESKSLKLYLNSFNMTELGEDRKTAIPKFSETVQEDLQKLLECDVWVYFYGYNEMNIEHLSVGDMTIEHPDDWENLDHLCVLDNINFKERFTKLDTIDYNGAVHYWRSNLLRSNCRVTNQPDWGDVYFVFKGDRIPTPESLARYIVSHRQVSHFHEEICEMLFTTLQEQCKLDDLMVACLYTRRGGIDINPLRTTNLEWFPRPFYVNTELLEKTVRQ